MTNTTSVIAIETATEACSAAVLIEKNNTMEQSAMIHRFQLAPREHTKLILPMLDEVLAEAKIKLADIDLIAFGRGPGAFTGLRIATGIAQGLALSVDKPLSAVSSLKAMANGVLKSQATLLVSTIFVAIDARMGEVYWAQYSLVDNEIIIVGEERLSAPTELFAAVMSVSLTAKVCLIGSGWDTYLSDFEKNHSTNNVHFESNQFPDARDICTLALQAFKQGKVQTFDDAQPMYLRNDVAKKAKPKNVF